MLPVIDLQNYPVLTHKLNPRLNDKILTVKNRLPLHSFNLHMKKYLVSLLALFTISSTSFAQMITGVWKGKIDRKKVELKIIQNGDSLTGTSYYYESPTNYRRYSIKGYFDANTNSAVWWDDRLIAETTGRGISSTPGTMPYLAIS